MKEISQNHIKIALRQKNADPSDQFVEALRVQIREKINLDDDIPVSKSLFFRLGEMWFLKTMLMSISLLVTTSLVGMMAYTRLTPVDPSGQTATEGVRLPLLTIAEAKEKIVENLDQLSNPKSVVISRHEIKDKDGNVVQNVEQTFDPNGNRFKMISSGNFGGQKYKTVSGFDGKEIYDYSHLLNELHRYKLQLKDPAHGMYYDFDKSFGSNSVAGYSPVGNIFVNTQALREFVQNMVASGNESNLTQIDQNGKKYYVYDYKSGPVSSMYSGKYYFDANTLQIAKIETKSSIYEVSIVEENESTYLYSPDDLPTQDAREVNFVINGYTGDIISFDKYPTGIMISKKYEDGSLRYYYGSMEQSIEFAENDMAFDFYMYDPNIVKKDENIKSVELRINEYSCTFGNEGCGSFVLKNSKVHNLNLQSFEDGVVHASIDGQELKSLTSVIKGYSMDWNSDIPGGLLMMEPELWVVTDQAKHFSKHTDSNDTTIRTPYHSVSIKTSYYQPYFTYIEKDTYYLQRTHYEQIMSSRSYSDELYTKVVIPEGWKVMGVSFNYETNVPELLTISKGDYYINFSYCPDGDCGGVSFDTSVVGYGVEGGVNVEFECTQTPITLESDIANGKAVRYDGVIDLSKESGCEHYKNIGREESKLWLGTEYVFQNPKARISLDFAGMEDQNPVYESNELKQIFAEVENMIANNVEVKTK